MEKVVGLEAFKEMCQLNGSNTHQHEDSRERKMDGDRKKNIGSTERLFN